ncbi:MAG: ATP-binding protein [Thermoanaerobaculaceae bacterium]|jgi:serine/threonine-protein kinase RsbW|nr:ATP-binding protein [Thermoanaerobaculaceae bacterium]
MAEAQRVRILLPLQPQAELMATAAVERVGRSIGFSRDTLAEVKLAVVEACLNALEYGGGQVEVEVVGFPEKPPRLEVVVVDHGPGFEPATLPTPSLQAQLSGERKRGWGLELMRHLMDEVDIRSAPGCTRVRMTRREGGR